jgi:hypothetical protein
MVYRLSRCECRRRSKYSMGSFDNVGQRRVQSSHATGHATHHPIDVLPYLLRLKPFKLPLNQRLLLSLERQQVQAHTDALNRHNVHEHCDSAICSMARRPSTMREPTSNSVCANDSICRSMQCKVGPTRTEPRTLSVTHRMGESGVNTCTRASRRDATCDKIQGIPKPR